ncbi:MAG TPA: hypothetical protein VNI02_01590 [Blastocatellia bacterium]|jgi:hypothetical protein|nr:hypothetical protein [Blastocatellia bacterium]
MGYWAWWFLIIQEVSKGWLETQITLGNVITAIGLLVAGVYGYSKMQNTLVNHAEKIIQLDKDLEEHCKNDKVHILSYAELINRLDRIETKVDARNVTSGRLPRNG